MKKPSILRYPDFAAEWKRRWQEGMKRRRSGRRNQEKKSKPEKGRDLELSTDDYYTTLNWYKKESVG